ncbi:RHS repeat domain-containing protein [Gaoshiqia sp. Z1-71]|uniref:RHS repeat domain-containing protein n=1 Tax=Gaoshiqia hydrogeniformans TaxID=3290090 RepID=UPI003BF879C3
MYYLCRDYLGSITHLADSNGSLTQELNFDAWGRLRDPATQTAYAPGAEPALFLGRGYTGHEHLPWFGLVNMNGRLYDPVVGRFLSVDENVQMPDFTQNLNRYSYALNNPLKFNDPDGEFFWFAVAIGAVLNVTSKAISGKINNFWDALGAAAIGGLAGAAGYGAFAQFGGTVSFLSGAASGGAGGFVGGAGNAWLDGAGFGQGLLSGIVGGVSGAAIGGIASGVSASLKGNNFWNGTPTDKTVAKVMAAKVASLKSADGLEGASLNYSSRSQLKSYTLDSELEFDGVELSWYDNLSDGSRQLRESWDAVSGPHGNGRLPNGEYLASNLRERTNPALRDMPNVGSGWCGYVIRTLSTGDL